MQSGHVIGRIYVCVLIIVLLLLCSYCDLLMGPMCVCVCVCAHLPYIHIAVRSDSISESVI